MEDLSTRAPLPVADDDAALGLGGVERAGLAEPGRVGVGTGGGDLGPEHERRGAHRLVGDHRADVLLAVTEPDAALEGVVGARRDRGDPGGDVRDRAGGASLVAGGGGHEHAGRRGTEERALHGVVEPVAAGHRVVQDVHAVGDSGIDRGHGVGGGAAVLRGVGGGPARLVDREAGRGGDTGGGAERLAVDRDADAVVAGCRGRDVRAVAGAVARGEVLRARHVLLAEPAHEPAGRHDLVRAVVGRPLVGGLARTVEAGQLRSGARGALRQAAEARVLRPDAGVHDADDDAVTGALGTAVVGPHPVRAVEPEQVAGAAADGRRHPDRRGCPVDVLLGAPLDQRDPGHPAHLLDLLGGEVRGEAVERGRVAVEHRRVADRVHDRVLLGDEPVGVRRHGGPVPVEALTVVRTGAGVDRGGGAVERHDVDARGRRTERVRRGARCRRHPGRDRAQHGGCREQEGGARQRRAGGHRAMVAGGQACFNRNPDIVSTPCSRPLPSSWVSTST